MPRIQQNAFVHAFKKSHIKVMRCVEAASRLSDWSKFDLTDTTLVAALRNGGFCPPVQQPKKRMYKPAPVTVYKRLRFDPRHPKLARF